MLVLPSLKSALNARRLSMESQGLIYLPWESAGISQDWQPLSLPQDKYLFLENPIPGYPILSEPIGYTRIFHQDNTCHWGMLVQGSCIITSSCPTVTVAAGGDWHT